MVNFKMLQDTIATVIAITNFKTGMHFTVNSAKKERKRKLQFGLVKFPLVNGNFSMNFILQIAKFYGPYELPLTMFVQFSILSVTIKNKL